MAKVEVTGTVSRVFASAGFSVRESFQKRDGGTVTRYWNVFLPDGEPVRVALDDTVKVTGLLQTEVSKRDPRYVDQKVSNATVEVTAAPARTYDEPPPPDEEPWAPQDTWQTTPIPPDEDTPF
jgi:hypothetical protein